MTYLQSRIVLALAYNLVALTLGGCAGSIKNMRPLSDTEVHVTPAPGQSLVIFMRPSGLGFAIQSSVFEIVDDKPSLIGIVAAKKKVYQQFQPGTHLFMVIGESADFMSAELEADKVYYALVTPRMGMWKARFSLRPVHAHELDSPEFNEWLQSCEWVGKTPESERWAQDNMPSILSKQHEYYAKWTKKDPTQRPQLRPDDGRRMSTDGKGDDQ